MGCRNFGHRNNSVITSTVSIKMLFGMRAIFKTILTDAANEEELSRVLARRYFMSIGMTTMEVMKQL